MHAHRESKDQHFGSVLQRTTWERERGREREREREGERERERERGREGEREQRRQRYTHSDRKIAGWVDRRPHTLFSVIKKNIFFEERLPHIKDVLVCV